MAYTGPGDLKTFAGWWGLRAYSAATAGNNCVDICATQGGSTTTIKTLANGNFDTASASTAIGGNAGFISKIYDQTGNGADMVELTGSLQPQIQLNVLQGGTLPELRMPGVAFVTSFTMYNATFTVTNPWTLIAVVKPLGFGTARTMIGVGAANAGGGAQGLGYQSATQTELYYSGFAGTAFTWSANNYHRLIGINNSGSSNLYIDGSANSFTGDTSAWGTGINIGDGLGQNNTSSVEYGMAASGFNSTDAAAMDSNINNYWFVSSGGDVLQSQIWM